MACILMHSVRQCSDPLSHCHFFEYKYLGNPPAYPLVQLLPVSPSYPHSPSAIFSLFIMPSPMIALALSFLALVSATPLEKRAPNCRPNFGGPPGLSIINAGSSVEWSLASSPPVTGTKIVSRAANIGDNEFRVEFTGQPTNTYLIKCVCIGFPDLFIN